MTELKQAILKLLENKTEPITIQQLSSELKVYVGIPTEMQELAEMGACTIRNGLVFPSKAGIRQLLAQPARLPRTRPHVTPRLAKPVQNLEAPVLQRTGEIYLKQIRLIGKQLTQNAEKGQSIKLGQTLLKRDLENPDAKWRADKLIGSYVAWRARSHTPQNTDNDYGKNWQSFQQLMSISHDALRLIIPYATACEFSTVVQATNFHLFAGIWICLQKDAVLNLATIQQAIAEVEKVLVPNENQCETSEQELLLLSQEITVLRKDQKYMDCIRYLLQGMDKEPTISEPNDE